MFENSISLDALPPLSKKVKADLEAKGHVIVKAIPGPCESAEPVLVDSNGMMFDSLGEVVLSVRNLRVSFHEDAGRTQAVRGISYDLHKGETLCIVGESGSGKSVSSKAIMGILNNSAIIEDGAIYYEGEDLTKVSEEDFHKIRGTKIGMIFQDPLSSLNPIMRIGKQIIEAMMVNKDRLKAYRNSLVVKERSAYNTVRNEVKNAKRNIKVDFKTGKREYKKLKETTSLDISRKVEAYENQLLRDHASDPNAKAVIAPQVKAFKEDLKAKRQKLLEEQKAKIYADRKKHIEEYRTVKARNAEPIKKAHEALKAALVIANQKRDEYHKQVKEAYEAHKAQIEADASLSEETKKAALKKAYFDDYVTKVRITREYAKAKAVEVMKEVGIPQPEKRLKQYPFEFSGGMRQRIVIAIALIANPEVLICDEPTTALDVTIQAQILELITGLKKSRKLSCIFITHDMGVVAEMADRIAVMYAGKILEYGTANDIFYNPKHPYTWALLSSIPDIDSKERLEAIPGTPPNMNFPPEGDAFALRSRYAMGIDFKVMPPFFKVSQTHYAATWLLDKRAPKAEMPKIVKTRIELSLKKAGVTYEQLEREEEK